MAHLTNRRLTGELMDDPAADPRDLSRALAFIRFVNRRLGGAAAAVGHLDHWSHGWPPPPGGPVRILDVATGSADIPLAILHWADRSGSGRDVRITGIDLHETTLAIARRFVRGESRIDLRCADALKLTEQFEPGSFDYVHAGMFLHHLPDIEALTVLRMMDRLASRGVIWNDLVRSGLTRAAVRLAALPAPRMARHDAIVSFDAGFTKREALDLAARAGWRRPTWRRHLVYRFTVVSEKQPLAASRG